jgi:hypothetical protein
MAQTVTKAGVIPILLLRCFNGIYFILILTSRKAVKDTKQKGARKKKDIRPNPEEHEGMPQHQHRPPAKRHEDRE